MQEGQNRAFRRRQERIERRQPSLLFPVPPAPETAAFARPALRRIRASLGSRASRSTLPAHVVGSRGFTLIEVLVVVVILGILAGLIVPRIMDRPDQARVVAAKNDIHAITNALKLYRLDNGTYPSADQGLTALVRKPETGEVPRNWKSGGYLERLPKDPWGGDYQYLNPGIHGEVDVLSLGADRQPGGEGYNADIGSWDAN